MLVLGFGHNEAVFGDGARAEAFHELGAVEQPVHGADGEVAVGVGVNEGVVEEEGIAGDDHAAGAALGGGGRALFHDRDEGKLTPGPIGVANNEGVFAREGDGFDARTFGRLVAATHVDDGTGAVEDDAVADERIDHGVFAEGAHDDVGAELALVGIANADFGDEDAEAGEEGFEAGCFARVIIAQGAGVEEGEEAAAFVEIFFDFLQLDRRQSRARAADDEHAAIGGDGIGAEKIEVGDVHDALAERGGEFHVAGIFGAVHDVLAVALEKIRFGDFAAGDGEQIGGEHLFAAKGDRFAAIFGFAFATRRFEGVFGEGISVDHAMRAGGFEDDEVFIGGSAEAIFFFQLLRAGRIALVIHGFDGDFGILAGVSAEHFSYGGVKLFFFVVIEGDFDVVSDGSEELEGARMESDFGALVKIDALEIITAKMIGHDDDRQDDKAHEEHLEADAPFAVGGKALWYAGGHNYFQRRLSTTRRVRKRKKTVRDA